MAGPSRAAAAPGGGKPLADVGRDEGSQKGELGAAGGMPGLGWCAYGRGKSICQVGVGASHQLSAS
jgi:hypothetical protein